ncbi:MAG TPA: LuxR C-terminal-related transcriptional regulator [Candidatus Paceibacterota bacterium]|nr:LuxR C-terminal-related transcriptional regulator [Candidatus Paceibacterota bacterium]
MDPQSETSAVLPARFLRSSFRAPEQQLALLTRPRLLGRLDHALSTRLLLITAPAGCGKSTLLSQWARSLVERGIRCAWFNVSQDAGPSDLLLSLAWAFELSGIDLGATGLLSEFSDGASDHHERVAILLSTLAQSKAPVVLVLDEFERLRDPESLALVALLMSAAPPTLHFVIASRRRSDLAISSLYAKGVVSRISVDDLVFTADEARVLLRDDLEPQDVEVVIRRTEGWPVAVTLAKLWLKQAGNRPSHLAEFSGSATEVSAYLAEQVVSGLDGELREFLLDVSVLDQVSPALADELRGRADSSRFVHSLLELRPAVALLDPAEPLVRLHPLLNEHLVEQLRAREPQRLSRLHEAAAYAYARTGRMLESIRHAMSAANPALASRLLLDQSPMQICVTRGSAAVSSCLRLLPESEWRKHPRLRLCEIFLMIRRGEHLRAELAFAELQSSVRDPPLIYLSESFVVAVMIAFRCPDLSRRKLEELEAIYRSFGCADTWARFSIETLALVVSLRAARLSETARHIDFQRAVFADVELSGSGLHIELHSAHLHLARGELAAAELLLRKILRIARSLVGPEKSVSAIARSLLFAARYEIDRDDLTEADLQNLLSDLDKTDAWFDHYVLAYAVAIEMAYRGGGMEAASKIVSAGRIAASRQVIGAAFERILSTLEADLLVRDGAVESAARLLDSLTRNDPAESTYYERDALTRVRLRLLLKQRRSSDARELASTWMERSASEGRAAAICRARIFRAAAELQLGLKPECFSDLRLAILWAAAEGAMAPFLELRDECCQMLTMLKDRSEESSPETEGFIDELSDRLAQSAAARRIYGLLTRRESEMLALLRDHPSNKHIARAAGISEHAVKFHLRNAYRKLRVHTRDEALRIVSDSRMPDVRSRRAE